MLDQAHEHDFGRRAIELRPRGRAGPGRGGTCGLGHGTRCGLNHAAVQLQAQAVAGLGFQCLHGFNRIDELDDRHRFAARVLAIPQLQSALNARFINLRAEHLPDHGTFAGVPVCHRRH